MNLINNKMSHNIFCMKTVLFLTFFENFFNIEFLNYKIVLTTHIYRQI